MSRILAIAILIALIITGAAVTVWYVAGDQDTPLVATGTGMNSGDTTAAPKKVVKTLTGDTLVEKDVVVEEINTQPTEVVSKGTNTDDDENLSTDSVVDQSDTVNTGGKVDPLLAFDVIRVEKTGDTVIAGRAPAGSDVRILDGTTILGSVESDTNGQWVYILKTPLEPGAHELGLQINNSEGETLKSKDVAIIDVPKGEYAPLAVLVPDEAMSANTSASKVIQLPKGDGNEGIRDGELALDSVDYNDDGQTVIGGTSQPGQKVVGYLNNEFVGQGVADGEGRWTVAPEKNIDEGLHQLRIDQVDDGGSVIARVEIPFSRSGKIETLPDERIVTVQPGNSLWRISRAIYGQGGRYAVIYDRNQDQIRNPDLIYPGQIFVLPKTN
ncbi:LysM peptidoglycan-binding domain-containing protein [Kiloniella antarctica]|uniref:LysM peptidoglycan-binding domain-containing protein n=1 Tax=Kiloniella antarctica TaxID=1550907 RepID=A0ABW5BNZ0_9PROT